MSNENPPAFPSSSALGPHGMDLRDWFAGQIANGLAARSGTLYLDAEAVAVRSYKASDALLAERAKAGA